MCEQSCLSFTDQSLNNQSSWQWIFEGGIPVTSSDQNPLGICYNIPGFYDVTLITTNANGSDTLKLNHYITVFTTPPFPTITQSGDTLTSSPAITYQWQFSSVDIPGATNQYYFAIQTGLYTVIISDSNGCVNSANIYSVATSVNDLSNQTNLLVEPNPNSGNFNVSIHSPTALGESKLDLIDLYGRTVYSEKIFSSQTSYVTKISAGQLPEGNYFLRVRSEKYSTVQRISIVR
jgi:hypothetical protein